MAIINKTGITNGGTIQAEHITRVIDALSGVSTDTLILSGSMTGSLIGALTGTASFATSASRAVSSSFAATASYAIGSGTEYMTLRLSSGPILGVTSGAAVYIGTETTSSNISQIGVMLPYDCEIVRASVYLNSPTSINAGFNEVELYHDITGAQTLIATFNNLDPKNAFIDADTTAVGYAAAANKWINVGFKPNATATGRCVMFADILIKKT
jgi:hypothetical protein